MAGLWCEVDEGVSCPGGVLEVGQDRTGDQMT